MRLRSSTRLTVDMSDHPDIMPQAHCGGRAVFVYGTLRRGQANDITRLSPAPRFVGYASIKGAMHDLGRYPGVVLGGSGDVVGEVYEIAPALEPVLDQIEEVYPQDTNEYQKREVEVSLAGRARLCLLYEINAARVQGTPTIASGDWAAHRRATTV